jgi:DNA-binding transcriptional regulator YdaS (Cro superfamily)
MSRRGFNKLKRSVSAEYRRKGYSAKRADYIGRATAGKVARQKKRRGR